MVLRISSLLQLKDSLQDSMLIGGIVLNMESQYQIKELREVIFTEVSHKCLYNFFRDLAETGRYNNTSNVEGECLLSCFGNLIQKNIDCFKNSWNDHRTTI